MSAFEKLQKEVQVMLDHIDQQNTPETPGDVHIYFTLVRKINKSRQPKMAKFEWIDRLQQARGRRFARAKENKRRGLRLILGGNEFIVRKSKAELKVV